MKNKMDKNMLVIAKLGMSNYNINSHLTNLPLRKAYNELWNLFNKRDDSHVCPYSNDLIFENYDSAFAYFFPIINKIRYEIFSKSRTMKDAEIIWKLSEKLQEEEESYYTLFVGNAAMVFLMCHPFIRDRDNRGCARHFIH